MFLNKPMNFSNTIWAKILFAYSFVVIVGIFIELYYLCANNIALTEKNIHFDYLEQNELEYETFREILLLRDYEYECKLNQQYLPNPIDDMLYKEKLVIIYNDLVNYSREHKKNCLECIGKTLFDIEKDEEFYCKEMCPITTNYEEMNEILNRMIQNSIVYKIKPFDF